MLLNGRDEPVATPRHGFHKSGILRGIPQRIPYLSDRAVDRIVEIDKGIAAPKLLLDLFPRHHFTGTSNQEGENLQWLFLKLDTNAALPQFACPEIQLEHSELV